MSEEQDFADKFKTLDDLLKIHGICRKMSTNPEVGFIWNNYFERWEETDNDLRKRVMDYSNENRYTPTPEW